MATQQILDQTLDLNGQEQYRLCQLYEAPAFVKQATVEQLVGPEALQPHLCGDKLHRRYPMHTKSATWMSSAFFYEKQAALPRLEAAKIEARLLEAADFWGILREVTDLKEKVAAMAKDDLSKLRDEDFAWVQGNERQLPLRNALEVRAAAEYLEKYRDEFLYADRQKMARAILQKAARYGASLGDHDDLMERLAGFGGCSATEAAQLVNNRAKLARASHPDIATELEKMAAMILKDPQKSRSPHRLAKVAETVDQLDRLLHIREYSKAVPRAEDVLFLVTRKTASSFADQHLSTTSGSVYDRDDLARLRTKDVRAYLGDELAGAVDGDGIHVDGTKVAEIVPTLPLGDARIFDQLCQEKGIRTFAKEAGARQGFTRGDLRAMAKDHQPIGTTS
jgi:hypothetical protein